MLYLLSSSLASPSSPQTPHPCLQSHIAPCHFCRSRFVDDARCPTARIHARVFTRPYAHVSTIPSSLLGFALFTSFFMHTHESRRCLGPHDSVSLSWSPSRCSLGLGAYCRFLFLYDHVALIYLFTLLPFDSVLEVYRYQSPICSPEDDDVSNNESCKPRSIPSIIRRTNT